MNNKNDKRKDGDKKTFFRRSVPSGGLDQRLSPGESRILEEGIEIINTGNFPLKIKILKTKEE